MAGPLNIQGALATTAGRELVALVEGSRSLFAADGETASEIAESLCQFGWSLKVSYGPPGDLDGSARDLWIAVTEEFEIRADELPILTAACRTLAEIEVIEAALVDADALVAGSKGQLRANPLFAEVRAHRITLRQLLGALGLQEAFDDGDAGSQASRSSAGRKLAAQRWGK